MSMKKQDSNYYNALLSKLVGDFIVILLLIVAVKCCNGYFANQRAEKRERERIEYVKKKKAQRAFYKSFDKGYKDGNENTAR